MKVISESIMKISFIILLGLFQFFLPGDSISLSDQGYFDFGIYPANWKKEHTFHITNHDSQTLNLGKVRSTCGCLIGSLSKTMLQKDDTADLTIQVKENSVSGKYTKNIYIETDKPEKRFLRLTIKGEAVPLLKTEPENNLYLGDLSVKKAYTYQFRLITCIPEYAEHLKIEIPALPQNRQFHSELEYDKERQLLIVKLIPLTKSSFLELVISISVLSPLNWPPLQIKLNGRVK